MKIIPIIPILLSFLVYLQCSSLTIKEGKVHELPSPSTIQDSYCKDNENLSYVAFLIHKNIKDATWADFHKPLVSAGDTEKELSLKVVKARAIIAQCAILLFSAVPTGSARNIEKILNIESALKDIDMSVPYQNLESANQWLHSYFPDPDKTLELSLLLDPVEILTCRNLKSKDLEECVKQDSLETTQIMLDYEEELSKYKHEEEHPASPEDLAILCPSGYQKSKTRIPVNKLIASKTSESFQSLLTSEGISKEDRSRVKYFAIHLAIANSAYYMQPGSIHRWVIDREDVFLERVSKNHPEYSKSTVVKEIESETGALEQYIRYSRYRGDFYKKYKYLFRAMDHIGFKVEEKIPFLYELHTALKAYRPSTIEDAHKFYQKMGSTGELKEFKTVFKAKDLSFEKFQNLVNEEHKKMIDSIQKFYSSRKTLPYSIWKDVCR